MSTQDHFWSQAAKDYEKEFIDPYLPEVKNPLLAALKKIPKSGRHRVADLGCGIGPLLPFLGDHFQEVHAIDFAAGMLARAKERCKGRKNIRYLQASFLDLESNLQPVDVAVAANSLVLPKIDDLEKALKSIRAILKPGGSFLGILPAMDAVHYLTMVLTDRALDAGKPLEVARKNAAHHCDHPLFDFAFGQFRYRGLEQHFWQPFEVRHRFRRAGFRLKRLKKVELAWKQFVADPAIHALPAPWDWFFQATRD